MFNDAAFFTVHLFDTKYGQHNLISFKMIKCKKNADIPNGVAMVRQSVNMGWRSNRKCGVHVSPLYILQCGSKFTCTVCSLMQHNNNYMPTLAHKTDCSILGDWAHLMLLVAIFFFASSARIKKKKVRASVCMTVDRNLDDTSMDQQAHQSKASDSLSV